MDHVAVFGAAGAIGSAVVAQLAGEAPGRVVHAFSRSGQVFPAFENVRAHALDYRDEAALARAAAAVAEPLDLVFVATGILHTPTLGPEKALSQLDPGNLAEVFAANTIVPAMIAKHFLPRLDRRKRAVFAALSARVGSISDNRLGGWYAYRASKSALNMIIRSAAIEMARSRPKAIIVGLHPGTVASDLSAPFQKNVPSEKLFTPAFSAAQLLTVLEKLSPAQSGHCFAWDGSEIDP